ncbi:hypothetical protein GCM10017673_29060 [Streptosporangium violaceochromogenes]|nr:hypothetical protein GCM10017673_29060 [Streptosporangium violaceochromogenes]
MCDRDQSQTELRAVARQLDLAVGEERLRDRLKLVWGPAVSTDPAPEAQRLRSAGATWEWAALGIVGWRFWDLHIGILPSGHPRFPFRVGLHWRACVDGLIAPVAASMRPRGTVTYSPVAEEYQHEVPASSPGSPGGPASAALSLARRVADTIPGAQPGTNATADPLFVNEGMLGWD